MKPYSQQHFQLQVGSRVTFFSHDLNFFKTGKMYCNWDACGYGLFLRSCTPLWLLFGGKIHWALGASDVTRRAYGLSGHSLPIQWLMKPSSRVNTVQFRPFCQGIGIRIYQTPFFCQLYLVQPFRWDQRLPVPKNATAVGFRKQKRCFSY